MNKRIQLLWLVLFLIFLNFISDSGRSQSNTQSRAKTGLAGSFRGGKTNGDAEPANLATVATIKPKMIDFMGINFHTVLVHDPSLYAQTCRLARDYHPVSWDVWETGNGTTKFPDTPLSQNQVNWDILYGSWINAGYTVNASLCDLDNYVLTAPNNCFSANVMDELHTYGKNLALSFGPGGKWPRLQSVEIENEPWHSNATQYAALFQSLASGIRAGNPALSISTCAVTADNPSPSVYDQPIQSLAGKEHLFDIISMHTYALKSGWPAFERSYPEDPTIDYLAKLDRMISWKQTHPELASKPIWITEFGFDAGTLVSKTLHPLWVSSTETEQALWIVRSFLVFAEKDIERAYLYWFEDDDSGDFHGASGIVRKDKVLNTHTPKPAFYSMRHLFNALGNYRFSKVVTRETNGMHVFEFVNDDSQLAWVVWSGSKGKADTTRTLTNLPSNQVKMETLTLTDGAVTSTTLAAPGNSINIIIGEKPKFLFFLPQISLVSRKSGR